MKQPILVIEDNEQNLYMITFLLEKNGYEVIQAGNGREGIELARRLNPLLILLDIQLPGMDGYEVVRTLRGDPETVHIPVVAITSYAMAGDHEKGLAVGCNGYIEKPIDPETFLAEIAGYLDETQDDRER